jgi:hypothetical protein
LQRRHHVKGTSTSGGSVSAAAKLGQMQMPEDIEALIGSDND